MFKKIYLLLLLTLLPTAAFSTTNYDPGVNGNIGGYQGTDWADISSSVSFSGLGTTSGTKVRARRVGDSLQVIGYVVSGTHAASALSIDFTGYTFKFSPVTFAASTERVGFATMMRSSALSFDGDSGLLVPFIDGTDTNSVFIAYASTSSVFAKANGNSLGDTGAGFSFDLMIPISGWSAGGAGGPIGDSSLELTNLGIAASVGSSALTIALKGKDLADPSGSNSVKIAFKNSTDATGNYVMREVTSALSLVISSGSTLGCTSAQPCRVYVWAVDSGSGVVLGASGCATPKDNSLLSTTAEGGAGAADGACTIYTSAAQTTKPARLIGRVTSTQATAGTWATAPSQIQLMPFEIGPRTVSFMLPTGSGVVTDFSGLGVTGASTGSGGATITFPSGTWNNTSYGCNCESHQGGQRECSTLTYTITSMKVQHYDGGGGGGEDGTVHVICTGY